MRRGSHCLWTTSEEGPVALITNPRAGTLPRAVVGTPSPVSAANRNCPSPAIVTPDSAPVPAAPLTAAQDHCVSVSVKADAPRVHGAIEVHGCGRLCRALRATSSHYEAACA
jgi:hypothetical protein